MALCRICKTEDDNKFTDETDDVCDDCMSSDDCYDDDDEIEDDEDE